MAGKNANDKRTKIKKSGNNAEPTPIKEKKEDKSSVTHFFSNVSTRVQIIIAGGIVIITGLFLKGVLNNQFTNWDDNDYINSNPLVRDLSANGLSHLFSPGTSVMGNYHPLTILTYAVEYSLVGLQPLLYHADSLILHLINTALVYWFINVLTRKPVAATVTAVLFGLHPMHVESVAWVAGRKDVVYGLFYLACCLSHIYFIRAESRKKWKLYIGGLVLFLFSLLGKPVAVVLPLSLLLIDYFLQRDKDSILPGIPAMSAGNFSNWFLEKIPHFVISGIFGIISIRSQQDFHALFRSNIEYGFIGRILLGCYALVTYVWKLILPVDLCCFYPYPVRVDGALPAVFYAYPVIVAALIFVCLRFFKANRTVIFGSLFFLVNIILLLQFIPVGGAIVAERYTYLAYIGLFFIAGMLIAGLFEHAKSTQAGYIALTVAGVYSLYFGYVSTDRCKVWYDSGTLWRDEIEKQPFKTANEYDNLALYYYNKFSDAKDIAEKKLCYDSTFYLLNVAIQIESDFPNPFVGLGVLEQEGGNPQEAKKNLLKALSFKEEKFYFTIYQKLAIVYAMDNKYDSAVYYFDAALKVNNNVTDVHTNYGKLLRIMGKPDAALKEFATAISIDPKYFGPYLEKGIVLLQSGKLPDALAELNNAIRLNTQSGEAYYYRAQCYNQMGNAAAAQADLQKAKSLGFGGN